MARGRKTSKKTKATKVAPRTYSLGDKFLQATKAYSSKAYSRKGSSFLDKLQSDWKVNTKNLDQNSFSLILGALIVVVLAVLVFNYFNKPNVATQTSSASTQQAGDVAKDQLPGKYTVKEGDTLFSIAQKYYNNGYLFSKIVEANKLTDENSIQVGQVLDIPKVDASAQATPTPTPTPSTEDQTQMTQRTQPVQGGIGGATNQTEWGEAITGTTYTVQEGDWLSKIAGRAYGNVFAYTRIAQANNIQNPDLIEPGMVLKIPR